MPLSDGKGVEVREPYGNWYYEDIRLATPAEIAAATTGKSQEKVVDYSRKALGNARKVIHCPTIEAFNSVCKLLQADGWTSAIPSKGWWDKHGSETCVNPNSTYEDRKYYKGEGYTIISASDYLAANGQPVEKSGVYKVGDWIVITDNGCCSSGVKVGDVVQLLENRGNDRDWDYKTSKGIIASSQPINTRIRPATQAEIQAAGGSQDTTGWQVGDVLDSKWLREQNVYRNDKKTVYGKPTSITLNRKVDKVEDGWAAISGTAVLWLPPKTIQQPLVVQCIPVGAVGWSTGNLIKHVKDNHSQKGWRIVLAPDGSYRAHVEGEKEMQSHKYSIQDVNNYISSGDWIIADNSTNQSITNQKQKPTISYEHKESNTGSTAIYLRANPKVSQGSTGSGRKADTAICKVKPQVAQE